MTIYQKLKAIREEKGLSQQQVADALYTTQTTISNIENGKAGLDVNMLIKFAEFYRVAPQLLISENNPEMNFLEKGENGFVAYIQTLKEQLAIKDEQIKQLLSIILNQSS